MDGLETIQTLMYATVIGIAAVFWTDQLLRAKRGDKKANEVLNGVVVFLGVCCVIYAAVRAFA